MENQKRNKRVLLLLTTILLIVIIGIVATLYFYNKKNSENKDANEINGNFTDLIQLSLKDNEAKTVNINGKKLSFKLEKNTVYLNNNKIHMSDHDIYSVPNNIILTEKMILIVKAVGQFGMEYSFYDLNGNEIKYVGQHAQYNDLKIEDGKLKVRPFIFENQWMSGYKIGNLLTLEGADKDCSYKRLKDYPSIVEEHKNDILNANYYFYLSSNELTLKYDKVLLTVGDLDKNTCVMEENNNKDNNEHVNDNTGVLDVTKLSIENGYSEITLNSEEKRIINAELVKELKPGSSINPIIMYGNYEINKNIIDDDCIKLRFVEWYIYHNNNSNYEIKQYMIKTKDELGNEYDKIKYSRLLDITKEIFNIQNASCNSSQQFKVDTDGYVWLSPAGGGYVPTTMKVLSKYKNGNNYYLIIHMYEDAKCIESAEACIDADDNPNAIGNSKYIKLKYGTNGNKKYLISFEYLN